MVSTYNCRGSINGIIVQNNPVNWIDPEGLANTGIGRSATPWGLGSGWGYGGGGWGSIGGAGAIGYGVAQYAKKHRQKSARPKPYAKPKDCPAGTTPIDQAGLDSDAIHRVKKGVGAGPQDWTGVDQDGNVITGDHAGNAVNNGPIDTYLK